jgi:hypothetical protein
MPKGSNPKSRQNLTRDGRPMDYNEPKRDRRLTVTETGWTGAKRLIGSMDMSVSDFLEKLGRGQIIVMQTQEIEAIEDSIDSALLRQAIAQTNNEFMSIDQVLAQRDLELADLDD